MDRDYVSKVGALLAHDEMSTIALIVWGLNPGPPGPAAMNIDFEFKNFLFNLAILN